MTTFEKSKIVLNAGEKIQSVLNSVAFEAPLPEKTDKQSPLTQVYPKLQGQVATPACMVPSTQDVNTGPLCLSINENNDSVVAVAPQPASLVGVSPQSPGTFQIQQTSLEECPWSAEGVVDDSCACQLVAIETDLPSSCTVVVEHAGWCCHQRLLYDIEPNPGPNVSIDAASKVAKLVGLLIAPRTAGKSWLARRGDALDADHLVDWDRIRQLSEEEKVEYYRTELPGWVRKAESQGKFLAGNFPQASVGNLSFVAWVPDEATIRRNWQHRQEDPSAGGHEPRSLEETLDDYKEFKAAYAVNKWRCQLLLLHDIETNPGPLEIEETDGFAFARVFNEGLIVGVNYGNTVFASLSDFKSFLSNLRSEYAALSTKVRSDAEALAIKGVLDDMREDLASGNQILVDWWDQGSISPSTPKLSSEISDVKVEVELVSSSSVPLSVNQAISLYLAEYGHSSTYLPAVLDQPGQAAWGMVISNLGAPNALRIALYSAMDSLNTGQDWWAIYDAVMYGYNDGSMVDFRNLFQTFSRRGVSADHLTALRLLLLRAGVESNPGPLPFLLLDDVKAVVSTSAAELRELTSLLHKLDGKLDYTDDLDVTNLSPAEAILLDRYIRARDNHPMAMCAEVVDDAFDVKVARRKSAALRRDKKKKLDANKHLSPEFTTSKALGELASDPMYVAAVRLSGGCDKGASPLLLDKWRALVKLIKYHNLDPELQSQVQDKVYTDFARVCRSLNAKCPTHQGEALLYIISASLKRSNIDILNPAPPVPAGLRGIARVVADIDRGVRDLATVSRRVDSGVTQAVDNTKDVHSGLATIQASVEWLKDNFPALARQPEHLEAVLSSLKTLVDTTSATREALIDHQQSAAAESHALDEKLDATVSRDAAIESSLSGISSQIEDVRMGQSSAAATVLTGLASSDGPLMAGLRTAAASAVGSAVSDLVTDPLSSISEVVVRLENVVNNIATSIQGVQRLIESRTAMFPASAASLMRETTPEGALVAGGRSGSLRFFTGLSLWCAGTAYYQSSTRSFRESGGLIGGSDSMPDIKNKMGKISPPTAPKPRVFANGDPSVPSAATVAYNPISQGSEPVTVVEENKNGYEFAEYAVNLKESEGMLGLLRAEDELAYAAYSGKWFDSNMAFSFFGSLTTGVLATDPGCGMLIDTVGFKNQSLKERTTNGVNISFGWATDMLRVISGAYTSGTRSIPLFNVELSGDLNLPARADCTSAVSALAEMYQYGVSGGFANGTREVSQQNAALQFLRLNNLNQIAGDPLVSAASAFLSSFTENVRASDDDMTIDVLMILRYILICHTQSNNTAAGATSLPNPMLYTSTGSHAVVNAADFVSQEQLAYYFNYSRIMGDSSSRFFNVYVGNFTDYIAAWSSYRANPNAANNYQDIFGPGRWGTGKVRLVPVGTNAGPGMQYSASALVQAWAAAAFVPVGAAGWIPYCGALSNKLVQPDTFVFITLTYSERVVIPITTGVTVVADPVGGAPVNSNRLGRAVAVGALPANVIPTPTSLSLGSLLGLSATDFRYSNLKAAPLEQVCSGLDFLLGYSSKACQTRAHAILAAVTGKPVDVTASTASYLGGTTINSTTPEFVSGAGWAAQSSARLALRHEAYRMTAYNAFGPVAGATAFPGFATMPSLSGFNAHWNCVQKHADLSVRPTSTAYIETFRDSAFRPGEYFGNIIPTEQPGSPSFQCGVPNDMVRLALFSGICGLMPVDKHPFCYTNSAFAVGAMLTHSAYMVTLMQESLLEQQLTDNVLYYATNFVGPAPGQGPSGVHANALKKVGREYLTMWRALTGYRLGYNESLSVQFGSICNVLGDPAFYLPSYVPTSIAARLLGARGFESCVTSHILQAPDGSVQPGVDANIVSFLPSNLVGIDQVQVYTNPATGLNTPGKPFDVREAFTRPLLIVEGSVGFEYRNIVNLGFPNRGLVPTVLQAYIYDARALPPSTQRTVAAANANADTSLALLPENAKVVVELAKPVGQLRMNPGAAPLLYYNILEMFPVVKLYPYGRADDGLLRGAVYTDIEHSLIKNKPLSYRPQAAKAAVSSNADSGSSDK